MFFMERFAALPEDASPRTRRKELPLSAHSDGPLAGLVVLDLATIFAGPAACRHLADFGADVIKIERPDGGDGARHLGETDGEDSFYWRQVGRNKRPVELDLKATGGREVLLRLVREADVLVENFRPGTLERLGLDPETVLLVENPGLVVLRVTGYGQTGPYANRAGFGTMAEAMSTLAHTTGQPDGPPTLPPIALADEVTGMRGAFAVLAALRHRDQTGQGQVIDITLLESLVDMVGPGPAIYHRTGQSDGRIGSRLCFSAPRNIYQCADGHIVLSGSANQVALRVFDAIGRSDLRSDPRFTTGRCRIENVEQLDAIITAWTIEHTVEKAIETFAAAGAAVGPVYDAEALVNDPHVRERGCFVEVDSPVGSEPILQLDVHPRMSLTPGRIRHAGLELGARTDEVLEELGYSHEEIVALRAQGAVGPPAADPSLAVA
jgi:crotonobetainyl-CoA:carnitine CoA-transferase CaiB-like acyl-CoA transferase